MPVTVERIRVTCDSAEEAAKLYHLVNEPLPTVELIQSNGHHETNGHAPAPLAIAGPADDEKPPRRPRVVRRGRPGRKATDNPPRRRNGESHADRAAAWIEKNGPARASQIAKAVGIPNGSSTHVFRDARFRHDGQVIALSSGKPAAKPARPRFSEADAIEKCAELINDDPPQTLAELSEATGVPQAQLFKLLNNERFEKTEAGYWLAE